MKSCVHLLYERTGKMSRARSFSLNQEDSKERLTRAGRSRSACARMTTLPHPSLVDARGRTSTHFLENAAAPRALKRLSPRLRQRC